MPPGAPGSPVLIVEDDADLREVYADALAAEGYGVELASDGNEALARLSAASELPCAVLLDLRMPGMDGWELARRLRDSAHGAGCRSWSWRPTTSSPMKRAGSGPQAGSRSR
ncbi:MAG: response regulator [Chloroflexota bacterium]|nr:response regulator [Chloroflexota bacterium]